MPMPATFHESPALAGSQALKKMPGTGRVPVRNFCGTGALTTLRCVLRIWLVVSTPLKNMKVSWDDEIPN